MKEESLPNVAFVSQSQECLKGVGASKGDDVQAVTFLNHSSRYELVNQLWEICGDFLQ
jgi:hypothetical protein